jgi:hypothetical protein
MTRRCLACLLLPAAVACGSDDAAPTPDPDTDGTQIGGQTGEETVGCFAVETRNLAWSELSPLGFSADALLNALGAERETRLEYADGSSTRLSLSLERSEGRVAFEEREWTESPSGSGGAEPALAAEIAPAQCGNVVSLPATLGFATSDGAFAEQLSLRLLAESTTHATAWVSLDTAALMGSFRPSGIDPAAYDRVLAQLTLTFGSDAWSGTLSGQASHEGGGAPDGSASARFFEIGSF